MEVKFKKLDERAVMPSYAKEGDAGLDLVATSIEADNSKTDGKFIEYGTGIAVEIPKGHVGLLYPRSSVSKKDMMLKNGVGVIDSGYRGEIKLRFQGTSQWIGDIYQPGDKVGQLLIIPLPTIVPTLVEELSDTERGDGGFGSTDIKGEWVSDSQS